MWGRAGRGGGYLRQPYPDRRGVRAGASISAIARGDPAQLVDRQEVPDRGERGGGRRRRTARRERGPSRGRSTSWCVVEARPRADIRWPASVIHERTGLSTGFEGSYQPVT